MVQPRRARLRVGIIGTGAISNLHARAYRNIGYKLTVCTDIMEEAGRKFAAANGWEFVKTYEEVCRHPEVDYVDVCTFPDFRLQALRICAEPGKHVQVQKAISPDLLAYWQLGPLNKIESEDVVNAVVRYASGATGVFQAATAFWPGYTERTEFHGTKGTAIISGDKLTTWDVENDAGEPAPVSKEVASGSSDPMAISIEPFERQFRDFGEAIRTGRKPLVSVEEGNQEMEIVHAVYRSCRTGEKVGLG